MDDTSLKLHDQAIQAALSANWEEAVALNQQILEIESQNVEALNRVARAYFELGDFEQSKKHYQTSLKIDPYNQIAAKFLKRIEVFDKKGAKPNGHKNGASTFNLDLFIEEPGKTKVVNLLKVAEPQKLSLLSSGDEVLLNPKNRNVSVTDADGHYIGVIPDNVSHQLQRLIKGGNKYQAFIKTVKTNSLTILIREVYRSARFKNQPSFLDSVNAVTYSSDHISLMDDASDSAPGEEEAEEMDGQ